MSQYRSRLDRFYIPADLVTSLQDLSHHPFMSDHSYVKLRIKLPEVSTRVKTKKQQSSGFWKLNNLVLEEEEFLLEFGYMWERVKAVKTSYTEAALLRMRAGLSA